MYSAVLLDRTVPNRFDPHFLCDASSFIFHIQNLIVFYYYYYYASATDELRLLQFSINKSTHFHKIISNKFSWLLILVFHKKEKHSAPISVSTIALALTAAGQHLEAETLFSRTNTFSSPEGFCVYFWNGPLRRVDGVAQLNFVIWKMLFYGWLMWKNNIKVKSIVVVSEWCVRFLIIYVPCILEEWFE